MHYFNLKQFNLIFAVTFSMPFTLAVSCRLSSFVVSHVLWILKTMQPPIGKNNIVFLFTFIYMCVPHFFLA